MQYKLDEYTSIILPNDINGKFVVIKDDHDIVLDYCSCPIDYVNTTKVDFKKVWKIADTIDDWNASVIAMAMSKELPFVSNNTRDIVYNTWKQSNIKFLNEIRKYFQQNFEEIKQ